MLKIFVSSTSRDLKEFRETLLDEIGKALDGVGMEFFVPRGEGSQKDSIAYLKSCDVVIFLISPYYGSLMKICTLKESCKSLDCPMRREEGQISFTHCEYKNTIAEGILHQTYLIEKDWDLIDYLKKIHKGELIVEKIKETEKFKDYKLELINKYRNVSKHADVLRTEIGNEAYGRVTRIKIPETLDLIKSNLADQIIEWHSKKKLDFTDFCDRSSELIEIIENLENNNKIEVYGVGGVGKTALIQVALLVQKLKGKKIISIGTTKSYASGSGFEDFKTKCKDDQFIAESRNKITIYDIINAFAEKKLLPNAGKINKMSKDKILEILSKKIQSDEKLILFIDDFHLASEDVVNFAKSVDHLILSSRMNTYIARKEILISGIGEEDREDLISLFSIEIPENIRKLISNIAEGHPVSTELLVKNYQNIDFEKIKNFDLADANDNQVKDFYERVIEEIYSINKQALNLLKNLAVLNTDLPTNINRESVLKSMEIENRRNVFKALVDTGMLKKREGKEKMYRFYFKHIQDALEDIAERENHEKAISYYEEKKKLLGENIDDEVEILFHKVKSNPTEGLVSEILELKNKIQPIHYGFKRLIDVGEELKKNLKQLADKNPEAYLPYVAMTQNNLGNLYSKLGRYAEAEHAHNEALEIEKELADKNPETYLPDVATTQNKLGNSYWMLGRFDEAEHAHNEALEIEKELADKNPETYLPDVATTQNSLGNLYVNIGRFEEAETTYNKALEIKKELADKNPEAYLPDVAMTQNNLGNLYWRLGRFVEAEHAHNEALEIRKELADKNPQAYLPRVADTKNNLGNLYWKLGRYAEAEHAHNKALEIRKELADKNPEAYLPDVATTQLNLGNLYWMIGKFAEAEHTYNEALKKYSELADKNPETYLLYVAITQSNLGELCTTLKKHGDAEKYLLEGLKIIKELAEKTPEAYLDYVAETKNNLGLLYKDLKRYRDAEKYLLEALKIIKELAEKNPEAYMDYIAKIKNNLGLLYKDLKRYRDAEKYLLEALRIRKELADKNPEAYLPDVADTQNNLGILYDDLERFKEAERAYNEALKKYSELADKNPETYLFYVATTQINLGELCTNLKRHRDAEKYLLEGLKMIKELAEKTPKAYMDYIAKIKNNLGLLYKDLKKYRDAEKYLLEALRIRKKLAEKTPEAYIDYVAETKNNLGLLYIELKRFGEAEKYLSETLKLDLNNNEAWYNKARLESLRNNKEKSFEFLKKAIELDKECIENAKSDESFNNIRNLKEFKELVYKN